MMNLDLHHVCFPGEYAAHRVRDAVQQGLEADWATTVDGGTEHCTYSDLDADEHRDGVRTERAVESLATRKNGWIVIFDRDSDVDFKFTVRRDWSEYGLSGLGGVMLTWHRAHSYEAPERTTDVMFAAARRVYGALEPSFAFSYLARDVDRETAVTAADVEAERIPDVYWMLLCSEPVCDRIGRDRLLAAPAWLTESLPDDGVGLVAAADPYQYTEADKARLKSALGLDE